MGDEVKSVDLGQVLAARALRYHGGKALLKEAKSDFSVGAGRFSIWLLVYILVSLVYIATSELNWAFYTAVFSVVFTLLLGTVALHVKACTAQSFYLLFVAAWIVAFAWLAIAGSGRALVVIYLLPVVAVLAVKWGISALSLAATIPLFIPVAFIIVLAPLLTEDPWRLSSEMSASRIAFLFCISVVPLAVFALIRVAKHPTHDALVSAFAAVRADREAHVTAAGIAFKVKSAQEQVAKEDLELKFKNAFRIELDGKCVAHFSSTLDKKLKRRSLRRLFVLVAGISISTFALIYTLAVVSMPVNLAQDWSKREVEYLRFDLIWYQVSLPVGPYVSVSLLFATLATVGFLAFASTDDKYSDAIIRSVSLLPAERLAYMASVHHHLVGHEGCSKPT